MRMLITVEKEMIHKVTGSSCLSGDGPVSAILFETTCGGGDVDESDDDKVFVAVTSSLFSGFSDDDDFVIKIPGARIRSLNFLNNCAVL